MPAQLGVTIGWGLAAGGSLTATFAFGLETTFALTAAFAGGLIPLVRGLAAFSFASKLLFIIKLILTRYSTRPSENSKRFQNISGGLPERPRL